MANIYCPECGKKHFYTLKRPEECQSCGASFTSAKYQVEKESKRVIQSSSIKAKSIPTLSEDNDSSDVFEVPKIKKLDYDFDYGDMSNVIQGKDLMGEIEEQPKEKSSRRKWKRKATKTTKKK